MKLSFTHTVSAITFVAGLATIGLFSHTAQTGTVGISGLLDGSLQARYEDGFKSSNPLKTSAISLMGSIKYGVFRQAAPGAVLGINGWIFTTEELEKSSGYVANIATSADRIAAVADQLAQRGVRLLPVIVPDKAEIYASQLGSTRPVATAVRRAVLNEALADRGVTVLDVTKNLNAGKTQGDVFMRDDTHWSPLGSRLVADAVGAQVSDIYFTNSEVSTETRGTRAFDGDLLAYVPTGVLRPWIGPAQNTITQFETTVESGSSLLGDAPVDVVLVGTSFSAKPDWHFEGFLKQALQADILNFAEEGQGPFAPMKAFLASETYQNTPLKLVIWEIPVRFTSKDHSK